MTDDKSTAFCYSLHTCLKEKKFKFPNQPLPHNSRPVITLFMFGILLRCDATADYIKTTTFLASPQHYPYRYIHVAYGVILICLLVLSAMKASRYMYYKNDFLEISLSSCRAYSSLPFGQAALDFFCPGQDFFLFYLFTVYLFHNFPGPLPIGQVRMKSDFSGRKMCLSWTTGQHTF